MNFRLMFSTAVFSLLLGVSSQAAIITSPTGLSPGDKYRLAFLTSTHLSSALSTDITTYNSFVQGVADAVPGLLSLGATWNAIGSTLTVDARDNTGTNPSGAGVPIYLLNDTKLADDNADLWDGTIDVALEITENGDVSVDGKVWSGTQPDGTAVIATASNGTGPLGNLIGTARAEVGNVPHTVATWIEASDRPTSRTDFGIHAMSSVLTVVPEPSSFLLLGSAIALSATRRRRQADC